MLFAETAYVPAKEEQDKNEEGGGDSEEEAEFAESKAGVQHTAGGEMSVEDKRLAMEERLILLEERRLEEQRKQRELEEKRCEQQLVHAGYRKVDISTFDGATLQRCERRLQSVLNAAVRLVFRLRRYDHVTDSLATLHWLRLP